MGAAWICSFISRIERRIISPPRFLYAHFRPSAPALAECLGRVVVIVSARVPGDIDQRMFDGFAPIGEIRCGLRVITRHGSPHCNLGKRPQFLGIGLVGASTAFFTAVDGQRPSAAVIPPNPPQDGSVRRRSRQGSNHRRIRRVPPRPSPPGADAVAEKPSWQDLFGDTAIRN